MGRLRGALVFCLAVCLAGCGRGPTIGRLTERSVVVAFGDSLTSGVDGEGGYPAVLAGLLGCEVVNAGVPGEVSGEGVARLPRVLEERKPDLVVLCHGGNDLLQRVNEAEVRRNVGAMIGMARRSGADVLLVGVPRPGLFLRVPAFYRELAEEHGVPFDGTTVVAMLKDRSLKSDAVHPNAAGARKMAETFARRIRSVERR